MRTNHHKVFVPIVAALALCASTGIALAVCGDGLLEPGEQCDDGNLVSDDGCDANCTPTTCGNGVITAGEACDDGNLISGDGCDANCTVTTCGNGVVTAGEACDDGNFSDGDGCDTNCTASACGNGIVAGVESCDDGNLVDGDDCDSNCTPTGCGNGIVTGIEQCDDGNSMNADGCSQNCQLEILNPAPVAGEHFGQSIAVLGSNLLVGAPMADRTGAVNAGAVYLVDGTTGTQVLAVANPTPAANDMFGWSVAALGSNILVGAPHDDTIGTDTGAVYLFSGITGALIRTFVNPNPGANDNFGWSIVALGSNILVGAPKGAPALGEGGTAYLIRTSDGEVMQTYLNPSPAAGAEFGSAVAVFGGDVVVGAQRHATIDPPAPAVGEAYIFNGTTGALLHTLVNPTPAAGDLFGHALAVLGNDVLVGAPASSSTGASVGAVHRFNGSSGSLLATIIKPVQVINDEFGGALTPVGTDKVAVGAPRDDLTVADSGAVYLFHVPTSTLLQTIQKPAPVSDDQFGAALAALEDRVLVGAPLDDSVALDAGAVYSFGETSCGNGLLDAGELCDDGNLIDGDGCDSNCTPPGCGNGIVTAGEVCDDGNLIAGDGCSPTCTSEGSCGDGIVAALEACDDGNLIDGDDCDSNCTLTGCGNGIVTAGEQCDLGAANGVSECCSLSCQAIDSDQDGLCDQNDVCPTIPDPAQLNLDGDVFGDACDPCPNDTDNDADGDGYCTGTGFNPPAIGGGDPCSRLESRRLWQKAKLQMARVISDPPGNESMRFKGYFITGGDLPPIAPHRYGVHVRVTGKDGSILIDVRIPGGILEAGQDHGWKQYGTPPVKWIFFERRRQSPLNGIQKLAVKDLSRFEAGRIGIFLKAKDGSYPLASESQLPPTITVELNDTSFPPGGTPGRDQCGDGWLSQCRVSGARKVVCF